MTKITYNFEIVSLRSKLYYLGETKLFVQIYSICKINISIKQSFYLDRFRTNQFKGSVNKIGPYV